MARPADLLERLPDSLGLGAKSRLGGQVRLGAANAFTQLPAGLAWGGQSLRLVCRMRGLRGGMWCSWWRCIQGRWATTLALKACAQAQQQGHAVGTEEPCVPY